MAAATAAHDLRAAHEHAVVRPQLDRLGDRRLGEARPARAGVELGIGAEQRRLAGRTAVHTVVLAVPVGAGERTLSALLAEHAVLLRRQLPAPLLLGLAHLRLHSLTSLGWGAKSPVVKLTSLRFS